MDKKDQDQKIGQIIARAWTDDAFKQRLLGDASTVLREEGVEMPPGLEVRVVENSDRVFHLVLPLKPDTELTDEQLNSVVGGTYQCIMSDPPQMEEPQ